jgi:uncharacterized protein YceK
VKVAGPARPHAAAIAWLPSTVSYDFSMLRLICVVGVLVSGCKSAVQRAAPEPDAGEGGAGGTPVARDGAAGSGGKTSTPDAMIVSRDAPSSSPDSAPPAAPDAREAAVAVPVEAGGQNGSLCPGTFTVCESFEGTAVGALPAGWARRSGYGGKSMAVAADDSARGGHALKIEGGLNGSQFLEYKNNLGALATSHWGRIFFKVKTPAPWPSAGVLHGDIVQHLGPHPGGGTNGVRWGIVENTQMKFQWIYNVQPSQGEPEFGDGTNYNYSWPGTWQCLEWRYDQPSQQGALWIDGNQIPIQVGKSHIPEIPVFTSLGVGWANYQNAPGEGFVVWIDEVAFDAARIGCDR